MAGREPDNFKSVYLLVGFEIFFESNIYSVGIVK